MYLQINGITILESASGEISLKCVVQLAKLHAFVIPIPVTQCLSGFTLFTVINKSRC